MQTDTHLEAISPYYYYYACSAVTLILWHLNKMPNK